MKTIHMKNPYESLGEKSFWKPAVGSKSMFDISGLWDPKFKIRKQQKVVTFGSCFAQHIGNALKHRGFNWLSTEKPPFGLTGSTASDFNYNIFSARTGNIYTTTLLKQWTDWALGAKDIPKEIWEKDGRFYDPFRPVVEPNGFASPQEVTQSLHETVACFREAIETASYFVFTLGLTESWVNSEFGYEYPMCPGTVAGTFDSSSHRFVNLEFKEILKTLSQSMEQMRSINPKLKFILTVSPVPLTATNSEQHVLVATMASKSILRAVTSQLEKNRSYVDYFPSYEIINSPVFRGSFFEPNQRNVNPHGVEFVMNTFFNCLIEKYGNYFEEDDSPQSSALRAANEICEEELLGAFGK